MTPPKKSTEHWLNAQRVRVYPRIILGVLLLAAAGWLAQSKNMVDAKGKPLGSDFVTFWAASHLALEGHAADAYNLRLIFKAERLAVPASSKMFAFYYPPSFYLLILPLALLPYLAAYVVSSATTLGGFVLVFRRVINDRRAWWCLAAFSGLWMNLFHGQNAFLTAAIAAAACLSIERRPDLAGVMIGLLAVKPHLALLFPVALLAIRAWRTLFVALMTALGFVGLGTVVLGRATLGACLGSLSYARGFLESGALPWGKMPTFFAFFRTLGMPVGVAYAAQAAGALFAAGCVWTVWRGCSDRGLRSAALMTATFLVSPYVFDYDLAWLAFPIAWLALAGAKKGWRKWEREILVVAWILPLMMNMLPVGPFVLCALLLSIVRRARAECETAAVQAREQFEVEAAAV